MAEHRPYEAQEPDGRPSGSHLDAASGQARNRPAVGAREAHSPQAADSGWQPGLGATDFLGLEPDLRGGSEAGNTGGTTESWLFDIEQGTHGGSQAHGHGDATYAQDAYAQDEYAQDDDAGTTATAVASDVDASGEAGYDLPADGSAAEGDDEFQLEDGAEGAPARSGATRLLVGAALCCGVAVAGWYGWQKYSPRFLTNHQVATTGTGTTPVEPAPNPRTPRKPAKQPNTTPQPVVASPDPADSAAQPIDEDPVSETTADSEPLVAVTSVPTGIPEPNPTAGTEAPSATNPTPMDPTAMAGETGLLRSPDVAQRDPELPTGEPGPGGGRHATEMDWAGMWLDTTIPVDAIRGPTRLRTLNVGLVRAELVNGEFVEGRLNAVGESRIWLDVKLGRLAFDIAEVRHLVQIVGEQGQPLPLGTPATAGLPRVEVMLPGGSLTGRVLAREGDRVTFLTEEGMRVRVDALEIRPAPNGRSRLIGRVDPRKP